jgi:hypothetical protein
MNLILNIEQYNDNHIFFSDPIKNNIMNFDKFIRIIYSPLTFGTNGILLNINIRDIINYEKFYNKYKCFFNTSSHKNLIEQLQNIEMNLLKKSNIKNKIPHYKIYEQIKSGNIKFFLENNKLVNNKLVNQLINNNFILKISGIWETDNDYGLTYKFLKVIN